MPSLLCAHIPWTRLSEHRLYLLEQRINPELYLSADALDLIDPVQIKAFADDLASCDLACTIHAPFMDLNPGSVDRSVRETTRLRVGQTLHCAELLRSKVVVFHPGYSRLTYGSAVDTWVDNTVSFWQQQTDRISQAGCKVALENIFEEEPSTLLQVLQQLNSPHFGHCFDSGHFHMFATVSLETWFAALGGFIIESHLHDNHGTADEHLPLGEGEIDFRLVTNLLKCHTPQAIWTLEAHSRERLERSMKAVKEYLED
jgi:sugar phosphate isomerase/epimerase